MLSATGFNWITGLSLTRLIDLTDSSYMPDTPLDNDLYYWRVQATNGPWSDVRQVQIEAPVSPVSAGPRRNYYMTGAPTLTWNRVTWARSYDMVLARDVSFTDIVYTYTGSDLETTVAPALTADGVYYWRVRGIRPTGPGAWSAVEQFTLDLP